MEGLRSDPAATRPGAAAASLTGFILSPAFYIWLGLELRRR